MMLGFGALSQSSISEDASLQPQGIISVAGPLGSVLVAGYLTVSGYAAAPGSIQGTFTRGGGATAAASMPAMLGAPVASGVVTIFGRASDSSVLQAPRVKGYHDFTESVGDALTFYVLDLIGSGDPVRVPISSWQATLQTGAKNYVQAVIPAALEWSEAINAASAFVITRAADTASGRIEYEMARAPLDQISIARGPTNYTATLSGYSDAFAVDEDPPTTYDRTVSGLRSITTGTAPTRIRCAIDWLLRPGQRCYYDDGASFIASFINYYVPTGNDSYMDVGE